MTETISEGDGHMQRCQFHPGLLLEVGRPCMVWCAGPRVRRATATMVLGMDGFPPRVMVGKDRHLQGT